MISFKKNQLDDDFSPGYLSWDKQRGFYSEDVLASIFKKAFNFLRRVVSSKIFDRFFFNFGPEMCT